MRDKMWEKKLIVFFIVFVLSLSVLCQNWSEKEPEAFDFRAYSIFKSFDQKILTLLQPLIVRWLFILNAITFNHESFPKCATNVYVKSQKRCVCMYALW